MEPAVSQLEETFKKKTPSMALYFTNDKEHIRISLPLE